MSWQPSATFERITFRAAAIKQIRIFFEERGYLEVDTPILSEYGITDVYIQPFKTRCMGKPYTLQTSPEYAMKRLLAAGSGPIFQLAKVFRDEERGRWHAPEFTLLEWYQLGVDHHTLLVEVDVFLQQLLSCAPLVKYTYQSVFEQACDLDPHTASLGPLQQALQKNGLSQVLPADETDRDQYLFLLMSHVVEPFLARLPYPVAVYDFPASQAALSRIITGRAARFEVYYQGLELANGFYELSDLTEQTARFLRDQEQRIQQGEEPGRLDPDFLAALAHGLPVCSGVALGVDRLLALAAGCERLSEIMTFEP